MGFSRRRFSSVAPCSPRRFGIRGGRMKKSWPKRVIRIMGSLADDGPEWIDTSHDTNLVSWALPALVELLELRARQGYDCRLPPLKLTRSSYRILSRMMQRPTTQ